MYIRPYTPEDCVQIGQLFYDTVHTINAKDYSTEQLDAWAGRPIDLEDWNRSFLKHDTYVALEDARLIGFADMDESGYLDRLYVHKDHQGKGVATALCDMLEKNSGQDVFITHASITARTFFEKRGYQVVREQTVERQGICLTNYVMRKEKKRQNQSKTALERSV